MKARVERVGNEIAVFIPASLADEAKLAAAQDVDVSRVGSRLVIKQSDDWPTLDELLEGMDESNRHPEWDTGPAVGNEIW